jgi:8-oxo-dGTP pyrophosphatase MutT (NUDIX family)
MAASMALRPGPYAAGVLPFHAGHVLLGLERRGWSGFSGRSEPHEQDPAATALREFREESAHAFALTPDDLHDAACVHTRTPRNADFYIFLVPLPRTEADPERFRHARLQAVRPVEREKVEVRWVPVEAVASLRLAPSFRSDWTAIRRRLTS